MSRILIIAGIVNFGLAQQETENVLKSIQEQKLPDLDDEFARSVEDKNYESLDDMKQNVRSELEDFEHKEARKAVKKKLAEKITELNQVDIPEGLLKNQVKFMAE